MALGINFVIADPIGGIYPQGYEIVSNQNRTEVKEGDFLLDIYDNSNKKADSITIKNHGDEFSFLRPQFKSDDLVKEVQLFDIADRFLKSEDKEKYPGYISLIKNRFPSKKIETREKSDLGKFFAENFTSQKTLEDLIAYSYIRYSKIIKEIKKTKPNQTFQNLMDNCTILDAIRFVFLFGEYNKNLGQFGYTLEKLPSFENDYFEIDFVNLKDGPSFRAEMNMNFNSYPIDAKKIGAFITDDKKSIFEYDDKGNYFYGIFRFYK